MLNSSEGGGDAQYRAFSDTWTWDESAADRYTMFVNAIGRLSHKAIVGLHKILGFCGMLAYLSYMAERLEQMHRLLKNSGSIYLHCDDTAAHYLKVIMDSIFGPKQYLGNIVWKRSTSHNDGNRHGRITDHILFYCKSVSDKNRYWDGYAVAIKKTKEELEKAHPLIDEQGRRYRSENITGARVTKDGESGDIWKNYDVSKRNRHWAPPKHSDYARYIQTNFIPDYMNFEGTIDRLDALDEAGLIHHPKAHGIWPGLIRYAETDKGTPAQNLILEPIGFTNFNKKGWLGYETQKPLELLKKLLLVSCPKNGVVLDPFCGCGTTVEAADLLGIKWVGIDISSFAIDLIKNNRMKNINISVKGIPYDLASAKLLSKDNPFNFESWAITRLPGFVPNTKQTGDGGIDGRTTLHHKPINYDSKLGLAQTKGGMHFRLGDLRDFIHVVDRDKAAVGCFITLNKIESMEAKKEVANAGKITIHDYDYRRMNLWSIEDYFDNRSPNLPLMNDPYTGKALSMQQEMKYTLIT